MKNKLKLIILGIFAVLASVHTNLNLTQPVDAKCYMGERHFLGLRAWYDDLEYVRYVDVSGEERCYVAELDPNSGDFEEKMRKRVWTIIFNILSLVMGIAGYLAIGLVMFGGFQYMLARGDAVGITKAKRTIANALIGLAICMGSSTISGAIAEIVINAGQHDDVEVIKSFFNSAFFWAGVIATILVVYNGIQYITATGDAAKVAKAKNGIVGSCIGLVIVLVAALIVNVVVGAMN